MVRWPWQFWPQGCCSGLSPAEGSPLRHPCWETSVFLLYTPAQMTPMAPQWQGWPPEPICSQSSPSRPSRPSPLAKVANLTSGPWRDRSCKLSYPPSQRFCVGHTAWASVQKARTGGGTPLGPRATFSNTASVMVGWLVLSRQGEDGKEGRRSCPASVWENTWQTCCLPTRFPVLFKS